MPTSKSAAKRMRQNEVRRLRNKEVRSRLRTFANLYEQAIASGDVAAAEQGLRKMESELHKAARKGVIPRARAARKTSRMAKQLQSMQANA